MEKTRTGLPLPGSRWRGLTLQMFLFAILPLTLFLLLIAFGSISLHHQSMRALVGDRDLRAVRAAANSLSHEIAHRSQALMLFADQLDRSAANPLEGKGLTGFERGLALVSSDGKTLSGGIEGLEDFRSTLPPPGPAVTFSQPVQAMDGEWVVLAAVPLPSGEQPVGARLVGARLVGAFSPGEIAREALSGVATAQTMVLLVSQQGSILYQAGPLDQEMPVTNHPGVAEVLRGESGVNYTSGSGMSHAGGERVVAFNPVAPLGWGLVMDESWESISSPLLQTTQAAPLILAPVLILAVFGLWFGARQVVQPLQKLERQAARLADGDFPAIREPVGGISEIQDVQGALVETAARLEAAQESLHGYIGMLTAGVENERRSLARELHDDTLQALIALNQNAQMAALRMANRAEVEKNGSTGSPQEVASQVEATSLVELQARITQTITNLRRVIAGLRPIYLEDLGLVAALGMLVREMGTQAGGNSAALPEISLNIAGEERRLPPEVELSLYRIAQEGLNNAIHHADARHIQLTLEFAPTFASLTVRDDGQGFRSDGDPNAFARQGHFGLLGMRERADLVGANLAIQSNPGEGTSLVVTWDGGKQQPASTNK